MHFSAELEFKEVMVLMGKGTSDIYLMEAARERELAK